MIDRTRPVFVTGGAGFAGSYVVRELLDHGYRVRQGPHGAYSAAKLACEAFGFAYQQSFGIDFRCVRPSALYGFGMSWFAPNYMKNIVEPAVLGEPVRLASGGPVPRDYANAVDVASLVRCILEGPADDVDRIFFAGTGRALTTGGEVGRLVREFVPGAIVEIADDWTDSDRAELPFRGRIDISNAVEQLGWEPRFCDLRDGIADYIQRFRLSATRPRVTLLRTHRDLSARHPGPAAASWAASLVNAACSRRRQPGSGR